MLSAGWQAILRLVPADQHERLILVTSNGTEINLQGILRGEADYLVIRGRLAASTEAGRVFFLPYDQINYIGFREGMKEAEIMSMLGPAAAQLPAGPAPAPTAAETGAAAPDTLIETQPPAPGNGPAPAPVEGSSAVALRPPQTAKAALLERLRRARSGQDTPRPPLK